MKQYATLDDTVYFWFAGNDTSGSGGDGAAPAADVRLAGAAAAAAPVYSPVPILLSNAGYPAGAYEVAIAATAANGFAINNTYAVFCTLAIDGQNPTGFIGSFDLKPVISNVTQVSNDAAAANNLEADYDGTGYAKANSTIGTCTTNTDLVTAAAVVNEWETQSQADPTGFHVNVMEINGTGQTANDNGADINAILLDTGTDGVVVAAASKTGYALSATGADLITQASVFALAIANAIWDDILTGATHNIPTSAGRRIREIGSNFISGGTAQGGTLSTIQLAAGELAIDHIYNRNLLVILVGTGIGQTRTIVDYIGATKVVHVDRDWWVTPDATSEYAIIPDDTPLVIDHGLATAGTINTITLRASASAISSTYNHAIINIMAGTGAGQSELIIDYNGGTKVATVACNWTTTPDATSVYVLMPYGTTSVDAICVDPLALIRTQADDALTAINLDHLLQLTQSVNDGAPNTADFITDSAVAIDDWYNGMMLVFSSGALAGLGQFVDNYDGATKRIYLANAMAQAPANGDDFIIVPMSESPYTGPVVADIADAVWDELEAGHTIAGSYGHEVTKQGRQLDRNLVWLLP